MIVTDFWLNQLDIFRNRQPDLIVKHDQLAAVFHLIVHVHQLYQATENPVHTTVDGAYGQLAA